MLTAAQAPTPAQLPKRASCARCLRPAASCVCCWVRPVVGGQVRVLILQHHLEAGHAKGTGQLLHLSLPRSELVVGEQFNQAALARAGLTDVLLYPSSDSAGAQTAHAEPELPKHDAPFHEPAACPNLRLIVLDATWRKSRKMLHLNPWLQALPRLSLDHAPASRYVIRKAHKPGQLSTLEAACAALAQLESNPERYRDVLQAFDGFVAQQQRYPVLRNPAAMPLIEM